MNKNYKMITKWIFFFFIIQKSTLNSKVYEIIRDIQATYNEDFNEILIAQSTYKTKKPNEPYYHASSSFDWKMNFFIAKINNLQDRKKIFSYNEINFSAGTIEYNIINYLKKFNLILYSEHNQFFAIDFEKKIKTLFQLNPKFYEKLNLRFPLKDYYPQNLSVSPNLETIALVWTYGLYNPKDYSIEYIQLIGFYDPSTLFMKNLCHLKWNMLKLTI